MTTYIIRRLLLMVVTMIGISLAVFTLTQMVPGGPVEQAIAKVRAANAQTGRGAEVRQISKEELENIKAYYGFDKPVHVRYLSWVGNLLKLDFGLSYSYRRPVWDVISEKFPISLIFGLTSLFLTYLISIPLGISKALKNNSFYDTATSVLISAGYVIPGFALGVLLLVLLAGGTYLKVFPMGGVVSEGWDQYPLGWKMLDLAHHMTLPLICYVIGDFAVLTFIMKNSVLEELNKDYVRTALAKGQAFKDAVWRQVFRNSLIPVVTNIGGILTLLFSGALLIERVFDIDGMGRLMYDSMVSRDYNVVMGLIMMVSFLSLIGRLISDISYVIVDPRIRLD